jgi:hypothetical protein
MNYTPRMDTVVRCIVAAIALYVCVARMRYALSHPELTTTQLFLHFWDAMTWQ